VAEGIDKNTSIDNIVLEVNATKFACDRTFIECAAALLPVVLSQITKGNTPTKDFPKKIPAVIKKWGLLIKKFVHTLDDQIELIFAVQV
jgi:translation initiation factor eIF-2B subunit epsilon